MFIRSFTQSFTGSLLICIVAASALSNDTPEKDDWKTTVKNKYNNPKYLFSFGYADGYSIHPEDSVNAARQNARLELAKTFRVKISAQATSKRQMVDSSTHSESRIDVSSSSAIQEWVEVQLEGVQTEEHTPSNQGDMVEAVAVLDKDKSIVFFSAKKQYFTQEIADLENRFPVCVASKQSSLHAWRRIVTLMTSWETANDIASVLGQTEALGYPGGLEARKQTLKGCRSKTFLITESELNVDSRLNDKLMETLSLEGFGVRKKKGRVPASTLYQLKFSADLKPAEEMFGSKSMIGSAAIQLITPDGQSLFKKTRTLRSTGTSVESIKNMLWIKLSIETSKILETLLEEQL